MHWRFVVGEFMDVFSTGRVFASFALATALASCTHVVLTDTDGRATLTAPLRYQLNAYLQLKDSGPDNEIVKRLLKESGAFSEITSAAKSNTNIAIVFEGRRCGDRNHPMDSFIGTWAATVVFVVLTVPSLGSIPASSQGSWQCTRNFSYVLRDDPKNLRREISHRYTHTEYGTTFSHFFLTSPEREQYQLESSIDHAIARLLSDINTSITTLSQQK